MFLYVVHQLLRKIQKRVERRNLIFEMFANDALLNKRQRKLTFDNELEPCVVRICFGFLCSVRAVFVLTEFRQYVYPVNLLMREMPS